jgi:hypothetical protein
MGSEHLTPDPDERRDDPAAQLIADAEQQVRLSHAWARLDAAQERERITGPVRAAMYAGERAAAIARTAAERDGVSADELRERIMRAYWAAYYADLADEAALRAASWRDEQRRHDDPLDTVP